MCEPCMGAGVYRMFTWISDICRTKHQFLFMIPPDSFRQACDDGVSCKQNVCTISKTKIPSTWRENVSSSAIYSDDHSNQHDRPPQILKGMVASGTLSWMKVFL